MTSLDVDTININVGVVNTARYANRIYVDRLRALPLITEST